jgi:hypothetical protein
MLKIWYGEAQYWAENLKTIWNLLFIAVKKLKKNPISPNFYPNNFKLYMRIGTHLEYNSIEKQSL